MRRMMGVNLSKCQTNVASNLDFSVLTITEVKLCSWHGRGAKKQSYSGGRWYENDHSRVQNFSLHRAGSALIPCNQTHWTSHSHRMKSDKSAPLCSAFGNCRKSYLDNYIASRICKLYIFVNLHHVIYFLFSFSLHSASVVFCTVLVIIFFQNAKLVVQRQTLKVIHIKSLVKSGVWR